MSTTSVQGRAPIPAAREAVLRAVVGTGSGVRTLGVIALAVAVAVAHPIAPKYLPIATFVPITVIAGLILPLQKLLVSYVVIVGLVVTIMLVGPDEAYFMGPIAVAVTMSATGAGVASRSRHGVGPFTGDRLIRELRDSLFAAGDIPGLPAGWYAERAFATAHGEPFSGDFNIAVLTQDERHLEMILVDVAGHGQQAATRSLALSGAISGLIGQVDADEVLGATNHYLCRAHWDEGFATAVHVDLDLVTGDYSIGHAGHPPAVHLVAATGRWVSVSAQAGPALGLLPMAEYDRVTGRLEPGDALLLYSDGIVESPTSDIADGTDWMLGRAEAAVGTGLRGLTGELVRQGRGGERDDRSAILLRRC